VINWPLFLFISSIYLQTRVRRGDRAHRLGRAIPRPGASTSTLC
jgi:hypothetical protein